MDELAAILKNPQIADEWKADSIREAIENGADPNGGNGYALRMAAVQGLIEVAKVLCDAGADPNVNNGAALKMAVRYNHPEIIEILRAAGAEMGPAIEYANARVSDNNAPAPENAAFVARDIAKTKNVLATLTGKNLGSAVKPRDDNDFARDDKGAAEILDKAAAKVGEKIKSRNLLQQKMLDHENS